LDRSLHRALHHWDQRLAKRLHAQGQPVVDRAEQVQARLRYHLALHRLVRQIDNQPDPQAALRELPPRARALIVEAREQFAEDGVFDSQRQLPWSQTCYIPYAFWDDDPTLTPAEVALTPRPSRGDDGLKVFVAALGPRLEAVAQTLQAIRREAPVGALQQTVRNILGLEPLTRLGWVPRPFEQWPVEARYQRMLNPYQHWLKGGVLPVELGASSPEGLGVLQDVMTDHVSQLQASLNSDVVWLGLPQRRLAATHQALLGQFQLWSRRWIRMSQQGRGEADFLLQTQPTGHHRLHVEVRLWPLMDGDVMFRQFELSVTQQELPQVMAPWWSADAAPFVTRLSILPP